MLAYQAVSTPLGRSAGGEGQFFVKRDAARA